MFSLLAVLEVQQNVNGRCSCLPFLFIFPPILSLLWPWRVSLFEAVGRTAISLRATSGRLTSRDLPQPIRQNLTRGNAFAGSRILFVHACFLFESFQATNHVINLGNSATSILSIIWNIMFWTTVFPRFNQHVVGSETRRNWK